MPALKVRKSVTLGDPYLNAMVLIPVYNYLGEHSFYDDLVYGGCPYVGSYDAFHWNDNATFANVSEYLLPVLRKPLCEAFDQNVQNSWKDTFPDFYDKTDMLVAEDFEGTKPRKRFTHNQWLGIRALNRQMVETPMDEKGRTLFATRLFQRPLQAMDARYDELATNSPTEDSLRYLIHSAHDFQIAQILVWLDPVGHEYVDIPYASQIIIELHYDDDCLSDPAVKFKEHCFTVEVLSNNVPLKLGTCLDKNAKKGIKSYTCGYTDFLDHIYAREWPGDYVKACAEEWKPASS